MTRASARAVRDVLAAAVITALTACGGSGSGPMTPSLGSGSSGSTGSTSQSQKANATATVTLRFPLHVAKAHAASAKSNGRTATYLNPTPTNQIVVSVNGTVINDPANPGNAYFALPAINLTDGTGTLAVPILAGSYATGQVAISEYDNASNLLATGMNESYTDASGNYQSGAFTVAAGGTAAITVTLAMNATQIAGTTDPTFSTATLLSSGSPTSLACVSSGSTVSVFPADPSSTYVLPSSTPPGYTGGDNNNYYPGIPAITFWYQSSSYGGKIVPSLQSPNTYTVIAPNGSDVITAHWYLYNPVTGAFVSGGASFGPGYC